MNFDAKVKRRLAATFVVSLIAFSVGFHVTDTWYGRWVLPDLVKQYPHDGQVGFAAAMAALTGGCLCFIAVLAIGILWTVKASKRSQPLP